MISQRQHGTVISSTQAELFTECEYRALGAPPRPNEHGVFEPDEVLACSATRKQYDVGGAVMRRIPVAEIRLVHIPEGGWLFAYSYSLSECGSGFAPSLKWRDTLRPTREEAIDAARASMAKSLAGQGDSSKCKVGRVVTAWLASGCTQAPGDPK
ncbi:MULTISPECIES: hypothetical protein [unclassified Pseudoxanthomonas]|uniref:hypothetical protein n=1 Tax=unclassified Pseudoxanthomonas TaxID=2645906 RepID=UPI00307CFA3D